jgi:uracil-DNA glycosylase family 4
MVVRASPPTPSESHGSKILLVFQAPGIDEWQKGMPLQPTIKPGGSAGRRIELSWNRMGVKRDHFDITNAVLCYPGQNKNRDKMPVKKATICCMVNLEKTINIGKYSRIIAFGETASRSCGDILQKIKLENKLTIFKHPCGGCDNHSLDMLWNEK